MSMRKKETALSEVGFPVAKHRTNCTTLNGLRLKVTRLSAGLASLFDGVGYCHNVPTRVASPTFLAVGGGIPTIKYQES